MTRSRILVALEVSVLIACTGCSNSVKGSGGSGGHASTSNTTANATGTGSGSGSTSGTLTGSTGSSASSTGAATGSSSSGMTKNSGDCDTDAQCAPNGHCIEVAPGGFRLCKFPVVEAMGCSPACMPPAKCFETPLVPACVGVMMQPQTVCAKAECAKSADCMGGVCLPAGTFGNKVDACLAANCTKDTDCTGKPGGHCGTVEDPCCHTTTGLYCVYPGDCRKDSDCGASQYCAIDASGEPKCHNGFPPCPA